MITSLLNAFFLDGLFKTILYIFPYSIDMFIVVYFPSAFKTKLTNIPFKVS